MKIGFDNIAYIKRQSQQILGRLKKFSKLYLEFGGKLFDDFHAQRVLPGFEIDSKIQLLKALRGKAEIILCINALDIEKNKLRQDLGITYDLDTLRLIDNLKSIGLSINSIVITRYANQPSADSFKKRLEQRGERVVVHKTIAGYPTNIDLIVSDQGYGANEFIQTNKSLIVVTGPGSASGKMATCLSQLYHEFKRGETAGYAKFETFPVWNLPLSHPINLAYEAATADVLDVNAIDPFHLETYGETAVNYNRDIEAFPIVKNILSKIKGTEKVYQSPTDMGVNQVGFCITDDLACREAAKQEVVRRYFKLSCDYREGRVEKSSLEKVEVIMKKLGITPEYGLTVRPAVEKFEQTGVPSLALMLNNGTLITGKETEVMSASSSLILNAVKKLAKIKDAVYLIAPNILQPLLVLKDKIFNEKSHKLSLAETLNALSICAATDSKAEKAFRELYNLRGCFAHSSHILPKADESGFRKLGIFVTSEPKFASGALYNS